MTSRSSGTSRGPGPSRYQRSSTASMTQLLSDSCSSLLHRLTSRVRGPSATVESPSASSRAAGLSLSTLGLGPLGLSGHSSASSAPWSQASPAATAAPDRDKDRERARDRVRATSPTFTTFGQTRSRLEKKYGQKKTSPPPSPAARRSTQRSQRSRQSKPRAGAAAAATTPTRTPSFRSAAPAAATAAPSTRKEPSPLLGVSKVRLTDHYGARTATSPASELGSTRSRLEDKYSAILAKYGREPRERDKDRDRPVGAAVDKRSPHPLPLSKSATTSIVLSEKAYPYVSGAGPGAAREKTPYRHGERERRSRQRSGHRHGPSRLCAVEFDVDAVDPVPPSPSRPMSPGEREAIRLVAQEEARERALARERERERDLEERTLSPVTSEREARRKEIQTLIAKYTTAVNDRLQRREQREKDRADNAAPAPPAAASVSAIANKKASNHTAKADSGTVTPTAGLGSSRATTMVANQAPSLATGSGLGHTAALGHGLGLGPGPSYGLGYGPGYGPGHGLGKSASGVFPSTHSDSGAIYKSQQKYSNLLNRRPNVSNSATSLALPNFSFVRSVHGAVTVSPRRARPPSTRTDLLCVRLTCGFS